MSTRLGFRSIRTQLTALVVALIVANCVILVLLVNHSTSLTLDTAEIQLAGQSNLSIVFDVEGIKNAILTDTLTYLAVVLVLGGLVAYVLVGRYTRPISRLAARMRQTGPESLSERMEPVGRGEEIEDLVRSFNQMTEQLDEAFAAQGRFAASAAHELRTPLAVLQTKIDVFRKKPRTKEEYDALVEMVGANTRRLSLVVGDLLELTETGDLPDSSPVPLHALLGGVCEGLEPLAEQRGVSLVLEGATQGCDDLRVMGNAALLHRAFSNLVENAIRYNREGGSVALALSHRGGKVVVTVADTGEGIAPDQRDLVFDPFYRVNKSRSRAFGGAGIGLSLVRSILVRHGASVHIEDNEPRGTVFVVTFPE
ncbi:sensor histidine kinase [Olsenella urininfantis]|uniref:sensor histidine kinase n=1 Tax=Olsenella urininfantis TaxID=1871033 RepID=UPI00098698F2|nr:ATP-binding protein [Olsenella urininfantis]